MRYIILIFSVFFVVNANSQILFSESFNVILDSTKYAKGSISPEIKFQTQKEILFEFNNSADFSVRSGKSYFTLANRIESRTFGGEVFLSGGYFYAELVSSHKRVVTTEYYAQMHWAEARGLDRRYSAGIDVRFKIYQYHRTGLFAGIGPFYEYENWNFNGVADERLPLNTTPVDTMNVKVSSYISFKHWFFDQFFFDISVYHQSRFDEMFGRPRLASSSRVAYQISKNLQLSGTYQNIYDYQPIVPIDRWFHRLTASLVVTF